ncbi:hypothetical protein [Leucobacter ruminantium]|uniref:Uncharacterized protein n=1 Tax=Leucobacter ruminantium TaxID=1289170 RepID=A0A939LX80_9MICO|nr:hypothetical protein [Leucobacter ruminantium]MBO1806112.1 hypothetical protein [Leucobacter ruminantium]
MIPAATVDSLQRRISEMQPVRLDDRALPTHAGLRTLLPGGALRKGASYSVHGSQQLALALMSASSASGAWCGVIGCRSFGAEAAVELGVALDRCVLIPEPGAHAISLASALCEILTVVLLRATSTPRAGDAERISARLREHGAALIVLGDWPRPESTLRVTGSQWTGLGRGHGALRSRRLAVRTQDRRGVREHTVGFEDGAVVADPSPIASGLR